MCECGAYDGGGSDDGGEFGEHGACLVSMKLAKAGDDE